MKKLVLAGTLMVVMLAAVLAAGCMIPMTSSPTPTPSTGTAAASQNVSQYLTNMMQQRNFTMMTPFSVQSSPQAGVVVYNGTASDQNGTYAVSVQAWNTSQAAQAQFATMRTTFMQQGYAPVQETSTMWSGFNASTGKGAAVEYGYSSLMPNYVMVITGGAIGQGTFQQPMWLHALSVMHTPAANGGMGPYMGQGMDATTRDAMRQQMQEHMGSSFSTWMMSGR
ncbi:MAG: hypothetical protein ACXV5H_04145 [Halobacteriota archaeon]